MLRTLAAIRGRAESAATPSRVASREALLPAGRVDRALFAGRPDPSRLTAISHLFTGPAKAVDQSGTVSDVERLFDLSSSDEEVEVDERLGVSVSGRRHQQSFGLPWFQFEDAATPWLRRRQTLHC